MFKILILIHLLIVFCTNISYSKDGYKIIVKVSGEIITNHDIEIEKSYLSALNPKISTIPKDEMNKIAKQSLIREIIKEKEVLRYFDVEYEASKLMGLAKNLYTRLNINTEEDFINYLGEYGLSLETVLKKLSIEANWNSLIYQKFKGQIAINKDEIKKKLELESSNLKVEKFFLLSEILFTAKDKEEYELKYKKIIDNINQKDFKSTATIYSLSDTAKFGGEIGWVSKNDISEKIYNLVNKLKVNDFSEPLRVGGGFLIIKLDNIKTEKIKNNLEEKFNNIVSKETNRQLNQFSTIYFKKIKKQSFIYEM